MKLLSENTHDVLVLTPECIEQEGLIEWARNFKLGTAGYRDQLDPEDMDNPKVAFNRTKVAIIAEAKARVYDQLGQKTAGFLERHVGGEVRPHTQAFIEVAARIYAAHGHRVHLRKEIKTTPIWYSSFGVFYSEFNDGENFTASHSPNFKGGWKPMDGYGKQLLQEADLIADEVRKVVTPGYAIILAPLKSPLILRDFDVTDAYRDYLDAIIPHQALDGIRQAQQMGFTAYISTVGGSMAETAKPIFRALKIDQGIRFLHEQEDPSYHGLGIVGGVNHGVDPGKWEVYKNVGAQEILRVSDRGTVFFIWDPDGDRFNLVSTAPASERERAVYYGLEVENLSEDRVLVYFKPNQIYFMLAIARIEQLRQAGTLEQYDWIIAETYPTSRSIGEIGERHGLRVIRTPVGFKYFGDFSQEIESQIESDEDKEVLIQTATGETLFLGKKPRILIMAEESGGAAMGGTTLARSKSGLRRSLVLKEKDGFQVGLATLALAARLFLEKGSFAEFYIDQVEENNIRYRYYERLDVTLYDENLPPGQLEEAKERGVAKRDRAVQFFKGLIGRPVAEVQALLQEKIVPLNLPPLKSVIWAGDGTLMEFEDLWWELRASGTDAVLRYYIEGRSLLEIQAINRALRDLEI